MMNAYLDNAATTRLHPEVKAEMENVGAYANPSSLHRPGREARRALEDARETVADILGVDPKEIIFTSGATEANNLAIFGVPAKRVITSAVEHPSVLDPCRSLEGRGTRVVRLSCDNTGRILPAPGHDADLVSLMLANNEVGTLQPVAELGGGKPLHCDAAQASGKIRIRVGELGADLLTLSAHKMHGPRGAGVLYARKDTELQPILLGGGQEFERRAGTENVLAAVGFAAALKIAERDMDGNVAHMEAMRKRLREGLSEIDDVHWHGHETERLPSILNVSFSYVDGEAVILALDAEGVYVSSGSACASISLEPSHVLKAMGVPRDVARGSARFSVAADTTREEIDHALRVVPGVIAKLRKISAVGNSSTGSL